MAIGFGSQTLVKDIVSGIFYLMDDAFRVGEWIESGSYNGVVESFSLRSIRLRHHRGAVFTVPFGSLGAIRNGSRDWTVDKFRIRVPFKTDINKVGKIAKDIGKQLLEDPELGPHIIKTLAVDDSPAEEAREVQPATTNRFAQQAQAAFWDDGDDEDDLELHERVTDERDELYEQSVEMVRRLNKASVSLLQRRLRIGYTRAARLIDMMEAEGVVGPAQEGSKPREVLPPKG